jgi:hypothetical protein
MNLAKLKAYAPRARQEFVQAVTDRAAYYGIKQEGEAISVLPVVEKGDGVVIGSKVLPRRAAEQRRALEERLRKYGFPQTMEAVAYTWFNRLVAIRYMETHGYLDHGYRVLSHPTGKSSPEIIEHAEVIDLPGLSSETVLDLKLSGNREEDLYRMLLIAQCNALHEAMPFLFERIDDETELLLPDKLLYSDSIIRSMVADIDEDDWQEVEILGWLYEAYISERYESVIGKVVASDDIPAATQRFTPKWIVRYLVQNTLGRLWLASQPSSSLRQQMSYYVEPCAQPPAAQEQMRTLTPTTLEPEGITFLDPACGSAHILVEAYDIFKAIYQEQGYRAQDIPRLILTKNLFGIEIDDRAAQLAAFALVMKARADDHRLLSPQKRVRPNILALRSTKGLRASDITSLLNGPVSSNSSSASEVRLESENAMLGKAPVPAPGVALESDISAVIALFEEAKTFGSLIRVPPSLADRLPALTDRARLMATRGEGFSRTYAAHFLPVLEQANLLVQRFDCVVANPPYMSGKYFTPLLKSSIATQYEDAKADLCICFIERGFDFLKPLGFLGEVTMQSWMFLPTIATFRTKLLRERTIVCMAHLGPHAFPNIGGQVVQVTAFIAAPQAIHDYRGSYKRLIEGNSDDKERRFGSTRDYARSSADFANIPGSPVAYWAANRIYSLFTGDKLSDAVISDGYVKTGNNSKYIRYWWEVSASAVGIASKWRLHPRGGDYRRWYGSVLEVVAWSDAARRHYADDSIARILDEKYWDLAGVCWSEIAFSNPAFRILLPEEIANNKSPAIYPKTGTDMRPVLAFLNSVVSNLFLSFLNPTVGFGPGDVLRLPFPPRGFSLDLAQNVSERCVRLSQADWDSFEVSWNFDRPPILRVRAPTLRQSQDCADALCVERFHEMKTLEEENNRLFIDAYGLEDELSPEVADERISIYRPDRTEDVKRLISYAVGCIMGRYSLDQAGLILANAGDTLAEYRTKVGRPLDSLTFTPDEDGIIPVLDGAWFEDDIVARVLVFLRAAFGASNLEESLRLIEGALGKDLRKYFLVDFYKDHRQTYKKRPIYWLFSSGKARAFQCLVYMHRYSEGTLSRMRTEYVVPLQGQIASRIEQLEGDKDKATSTSHRKKLHKEQDLLKKQQTELLIFDEKLKHAAGQKISLNLDDGVKVNYGKFVDLLADVDAVTGGADE